MANALKGALVSPVITAHPTETRRRTVFVTQHRITELMRLHAEGHTETDDGRNIERELRRQVLTLWQTALIRLSRLQITDEIDVGPAVLPGRVVQGDPAGQRRSSGGASGSLAGCRAAVRADPATRLLDRRRPRRQPQCDCGGGSAGHRQRRVHRFVALPGRTHRSRAGAVDVGAADHRHPGVGRAGAGMPGKRPHRRALPARVAGDPRTAHRDRRRNPGPSSATRARPGSATLCRHRPNCGPIWTPSTRRCARTAARCWPTIGWPCCEKPCTSSGFTCPAWICGKTPTCTKR